MLAFLRKHGWDILTILFLLVVGILLLVNPSTFGTLLIRVFGALLAVAGLYRIIRYFRTPALMAAEGSDFFTGLLALCVGGVCAIWAESFTTVFPVLAVFYGLVQILLGFLKLQRTVDALRLGQRSWYVAALSAVVSLVFGFIIVLNPNMALMSVWTFTGITLILEAIFDIVALFMVRDEPEKYVPGQPM